MASSPVEAGRVSAELLAPAMMIASGSIHAVVNAILKSGRDKMTARSVIDGSSAILLLPALFFVPLPHGAWHWLGASALIHCIYLYALVRAFEASDMSAAYPILRGVAPLITAAVTVGVLGESASIGDLLGTALIGFAVLMMVAGKHIQAAGLGWSLATAAMIAAYTIVDAAGVRAAPTPTSYIVWLFVIAGIAVVSFFAVISRGAILQTARGQWRAGVIAGALSIVTYGLAMHAYALGPTAPLAALRETGMITALLISLFVLKERVGWLRAASVLGVMAGATLILTR
ncbi:DMT family transporter [Sphingomonas sp. HF-S3]|uniref:DMT family transporter n=1 Tax=Sphingomonas rustica TaxID=3103142 RepID=A0ABV0B1X3_9SPHN